MKPWVLFGVLATTAMALGCGDGGSSAPPVSSDATQTALQSDELKKVLQTITESGEGGSAVMGVRPAIEKIKEADAAKGETLLKELNQLEATSDANKRKAIAKKMLELL